MVLNNTEPAFSKYFLQLAHCLEEFVVNVFTAHLPIFINIRYIERKTWISYMVIQYARF